MSAGERKQAGGARKTPREGDGRIWADVRHSVRTRMLPCWSAVVAASGSAGNMVAV